MLIWVPVVLVPALFSLSGGPAQVLLQVGLVAAMAGASIVAIVTHPPRSGWALGLLAVAVVVASRWGDAWLAPWVLLAMCAGAVAPCRFTFLALPAVAAGSLVAGWRHAPDAELPWLSAGSVLLAGITAAVVLRLIDTISELHRTRGELARAAVVEERDRFSRDLHDLLGHSLSVMVVKADAVRRLAGDDPELAATHAADIARVGREALAEVRETVDGMRAPSLEEALDGARSALAAAGIETEVVTADGPPPRETEGVLAWVVREATTNVLRHSGADACRIELQRTSDRWQLTVADDGVGGPPVTEGRVGGLDGLRRRLESAGGSLDLRPGSEGFRLVALVPGGGV